MKTPEPEILASLDASTDDELRLVIGKSERLLEERDQQRKKAALDHARAILAEAGLTYPGEAGKQRGRRKAAAGRS